MHKTNFFNKPEVTRYVIYTRFAIAKLKRVHEIKTVFKQGPIPISIPSRSHSTHVQFIGFGVNAHSALLHLSALIQHGEECGAFILKKTSLEDVCPPAQAPPDPRRAEQSRAQQSTAEQSRAVQSRAQQSRAQQSRAVHNRAEPTSHCGCATVSPGVATL